MRSVLEREPLTRRSVLREIADVGRPLGSGEVAAGDPARRVDPRFRVEVDPTSLERVGTIALEIDCGSVTATSDLVVAVTYNEDAGESGSSAATFIDPATNETMATIDLPVDVNSTPVILDRTVFLSGHLGSTAVVVDRATWTISATPDLGQPTSGSLAVTDGMHIYVPTADGLYVVVVDAATNAVTGTIETLGSNSVALLDGSLWTASGRWDLVQRFDDV